MKLATYTAFLFDLDGVITPTAEVHMTAWSEMFNNFLATQPDQQPYVADDYFRFVDGKPRYDGVRDFLASRGINLAEGTPGDDPAKDTVCGLGNRKNAVFNEIVARDGVQPYPGSVTFIEQLADQGKRLAVVSSSKNAPAVLAAAGMSDYFELIVDGNVARENQLAGKPAPDTYAFAAAALGVPDQESVVLEDAISGVAAGAAGDFGLVIGVDRGVGVQALEQAGADLVVSDLGELVTK